MDALSEISDGGVLASAEAVGSSGVKANFNVVVGSESSGVVEGDPQAGIGCARWIEFDARDQSGLLGAIDPEGEGGLSRPD